MVLLLVREFIVIVGCVLSAYTDFKKGIIPDKVTLPMIGAGVLLSIYELVVSGISLNSALMLFAPGAVVFALGFLLYFLGKVGGGDVKLFTAIALVLPFIGDEIFVLNVLFISILAASFAFGLYYSVRYALKGIDLRENSEGVSRAMIFGVIIFGYFYFLNSMGFIAAYSMVVVGVPVLFALLFLAFEKGIRKNFFLKSVKIGELEEDEIIAKEFLDRETLSKLDMRVKGVIGESEKKRLLELGLKEVMVYRELPKFGPFILFGAVVAIAFPKIVETIFL